jgi:hypothetical protein
MKPCPFCGGKDITICREHWRDDQDIAYCQCNRCGARGPKNTFYYSKHAVPYPPAEAWDMRVDSCTCEPLLQLPSVESIAHTLTQLKLSDCIKVVQWIFTESRVRKF